MAHPSKRINSTKVTKERENISFYAKLKLLKLDQVDGESNEEQLQFHITEI